MQLSTWNFDDYKLDTSVSWPVLDAQTVSRMPAENLLIIQSRRFRPNLLPSLNSDLLMDWNSSWLIFTNILQKQLLYTSYVAINRSLFKQMGVFDKHSKLANGTENMDYSFRPFRIFNILVGMRLSLSFNLELTRDNVLHLCVIGFTFYNIGPAENRFLLQPNRNYENVTWKSIITNKLAFNKVDLKHFDFILFYNLFYKFEFLVIWTPLGELCSFWRLNHQSLIKSNTYISLRC